MTTSPPTADVLAPRRDPGARLRELWPALVVAGAVGVFCAVIAGSWFIDLRVYRMGGAGIGGGHLYELTFGDIALPYTYPPFAAVVMAPFAVLPFAAVAGLMGAASVTALAAVLRRVGALVGVPLRGWWLALATVAAIGLEPVWSTLSFGQVNLLLMAAIALDVLPARADGRPWRWSGLGVGVAAGIKLTPLVFVVFLALTGRVRAALTALAGFAATIVVGFVVDPYSAWDYWSGVAFDAARVGGVGYAGNQSTLGVLARILDREPSTLLWLGVAGALSLAALAVAVVVHRRGAPVLGLCLAAFSMLLASPISWDHHWVWAAPTALALWSWTTPRLRLPVVAAWVAVFASACVWWFGEHDEREYSWAWWQQAVGGGFFVAALALVVGCAVVLLRGDRRSAARRAASARG